MISLIADTFAIASIWQIAQLIAWAVTALKITATGLVLALVAPFLFGELVEILKKLDRRALRKDAPPTSRRLVP